MEKVYQCSKCLTIIEKLRPPSISGCHGRGVHSWNNLGAIGKYESICKKCGLKVKTMSEPTKWGCSIGSSHHWLKFK